MSDPTRNELADNIARLNELIEAYFVWKSIPLPEAYPIDGSTRAVTDSIDSPQP